MLVLTDRDERLLSGAEGAGAQLAMRVVVKLAEVTGASSLVDITRAHVSSCFYSGQLGVDFAEFLLATGARPCVPTATNVGLIDLLHPELRPESSYPAEVQGAKRLMDIYEQLGCELTWTCAPYQELDPPALGEHIVASESNAVAFYNSVDGARTNKYGDLIDICAAVVGRVPYAGLHTDEGRAGQVLFRLQDCPHELLAEDVAYQLLGVVIGQTTGTQVPVVDGLPSSVSTDQLRATCSAAATAGSVSLIHAVRITPEAESVEHACQGHSPNQSIDVTPSMLADARDLLTATSGGPVGAVCLGTPHFSIDEFEVLVGRIDGATVNPNVTMYVSTSRHVVSLLRGRGWDHTLRVAGVSVVVDTCTYYSPAAAGIRGTVMTNSAKWAYYAPGMLDINVVFASLEECVASAIKGEVVHDEALWSDDLWREGSG